MKKKITLIFFLLITFTFIPVVIEAKTTKNLVNIYFFHSNTCSHCKEEEILLKELKKKYNNIRIYKYEVHEQKTQNILKKTNEIYKLKTNSVPFTIIGNKDYSGFSYEKSKLKFIKTIEYYSKYGYNDELGKYLELELPKFNENKSNPTLEEFIDEYHNYNLLGLKTDNLDPTNTSIILGGLSVFNVINIIEIIIILIIISLIINPKTKLILLVTYIVIKMLLITNNIINNIILNNIIYTIILLILIFGIIKLIQKKKIYLKLNKIIIITYISNYLILKINNNINIFKNILELNNLTGLTKITYYNNYVIMSLIINILVTYIVYLIIKKIKELKIQIIKVNT